MKPLKQSLCALLLALTPALAHANGDFVRAAVVIATFVAPELAPFAAALSLGSPAFGSGATVRRLRRTKPQHNKRRRGAQR